MKDRNKPAHLYQLIGIDSDEIDGGDEENFGFRPVGYGVQDIPSIIEAANASGAEWLVVEQDNPTPGKTPMECVEMGINFLRKL
jgi:sugar phosphate isomerase/epimerase